MQMKILIIAIISLTLCTAFIFISSHLVCLATNEISNEISSLPASINKNSPDELIGRIEESLNIWRSHRLMLCLVISHKEFDDVENGLISLSAFVRTGDDGNYAAGLDALRERLTKLRTSESLSFDSII